MKTTTKTDNNKQILADTASVKYMKIIMETAIYIVVGILCGSIFFRQVIFSNFDLLLGDVGDAAFYSVLLEHWWQVIHGTAQWLSPIYFFPAQGTLGYSDIGFLNAIPYIALRFAGIDSFTSCQVVLFALVALGWIGMILFLRLCLKLGMVPTIMGTILFVFPNVAANSAGHTHLLNVCLIPYLAIGIYFFLPNIKKSTFCGTAAGVFLAVFIPALFYTSYYTGWFPLFFILLLSGVFCGLSMMSLGAKVVWKRIIWKRKNVRFFLPYCIIAAVCFIPFLLTYIPPALEFGSRSYQEISSMLPSLIDYVNVGPNNWLWGKMLYSSFPDVGSRPMAHELVKGLPFFTFFISLVLLFFYVRKIENYKLAMLQDDNCRIIITGREATKSEKLTILAAGLSITILLAWLLMLKIQGISLWWLVSKVIPGAGAIRAVYRFQQVLYFPLAIVIAIGLHQFINYVKGHKHSYLKKGIFLVTLAIFCLLLVVEQFNTGSFANYSKQRQRDMLAAIKPPPQQAKVFALLPAKRFILPYKAQVNAMLIAQKYGLYTINGYSGQFPHGWHGIYYYNRPSYMSSLTRWIKRHNLNINQLYFLNMNTGHWHLSANLMESITTQINKTSFSTDTFSQVGRVSGDNILSTGKRGFLIFGPYTPMDPGKYRFTLKGKGLVVDTAWGDIVSKKGTITHCKFNLRRTSDGDDILAEGTVTLDKAVDDIEIRVYVGKKDNILIKSYRLIPIKG